METKEKRKREPTSLKVDPVLWEEVKIMAIRTKRRVTEYFDEALRDKLAKDYEIIANEKRTKDIIVSQMQAQPDNEEGLKDFIKQYAKRIEKTESETEELLRGQAQENGLNILEWVQYLRLNDKIMGKREKAQQPQERERMKLEYSLVLPGLKFPATKDEIIECAEKAQYPEGDKEQLIRIAINILKQLPDDKYMGKNKLEKDFSNILSHVSKDLQGQVITIVYDEQGEGDKQPQAQQREVT